MNAARFERTNFFKVSSVAVMLAAWLLMAVAGAVAVLLQQEPVQAQASSSSPSYTVTDLGTLGAKFSVAFGINDYGHVVGQSIPPNGPFHAFLYKDSQMIDLGALLEADGKWRNSGAFDINDYGQVVGTAESIGIGIETHPYAFLYENGSITELGTLGGHASEAFGINETGQVVGRSVAAGGNTHAFLYENSSMTDLKTLGGAESSASDINDTGQVVGYSQTAGGDTHAFLFESGSMTDLGTLGGSESRALGVNGAGQVVGSSHTVNGETHAFLFEDGHMTNLGTLGGAESSASDINDIGQVVGRSQTASGEFHAFLYNGQMTDLNALIPADSGWTLQGANAINNEGQIVGIGRNKDDELRAFLLEPSTDSIAPTLTLPADITEMATTPDGAEVSFTATATDDVDGPITPTCVPASGSLFPIGTTTVACSATDQAGNKATGSFNITVKGTTDQISDTKGLVTSLNLPDGIDTSLQVKLNDALAAANAGDTASACTALEDFISQVRAQSGKKITASDAERLIAEAGRIKGVLACS